MDYTVDYKKRSRPENIASDLHFFMVAGKGIEPLTRGF
jgi:hypothetical protein